MSKVPRQLREWRQPLPVYRLPEEQYYRERNAYVDRLLEPTGNREMDDSFRGHLEKIYGGPW